jgi:aminoglycoside phosphotransferase (APT) family kinase protein
MSSASADKIVIDSSLVSRLISAQFPQWADLPVRPVRFGGWDNRTFHLGEYMTVRLPSAASYALQVEKGTALAAATGAAFAAAYSRAAGARTAG